MQNCKTSEAVTASPGAFKFGKFAFDTLLLLFLGPHIWRRGLNVAADAAGAASAACLFLLFSDVKVIKNEFIGVLEGNKAGLGILKGLFHDILLYHNLFYLLRLALPALFW